MGVWECIQVIDFDQSTTTMKEERNKYSLLGKSDKSIICNLLHKVLIY